MKFAVQESRGTCLSSKPTKLSSKAQMTSLLGSAFVEPQNYFFSTAKDHVEAFANSKESLFRSEVSLPKTIKTSQVSVLSS